MTDMYTPKGWDLSDLLAEPVEESLASDLAAIEEKVAAFEAHRNILTDDIEPSAFLDYLGRYEAILRIAFRLNGYANLRFAANTQDTAALNLRDRVNHALTDVDNRTLFFTLWMKNMPEETAARILPEAGEFRYYLELLRKFQPHMLSEPEEQVVNLKDANGIDAMMNLYDMVTSSFKYELEVDGEHKTLTRDQLTAYYRHPSPDVRAATYQELFRVFSDNSTVLAQMYNHRVRDWHSEGKLRDFAQPIDVRNLANDLPGTVVDTLLDVCRQNNDVFQRYFKLKAGWLGMDKLRRYDIYAPLAASDKVFDYDYAVNLTMDAFGRFSPRLVELSERVFKENHIDSETRPGKRGGAFCYSSLPELTPWVMVNYTGRARDVATLAHELGHAIHAMLASGHSALTFHSSLPLAETASVFAEMLLTDRLLREESDKAVRRDLLAAAVDDAYATVQRQVYFTIYEREAHRLIAEGKDVDALREAYLACLNDQFGDSLEISDDFQWEWISIPHIYHVPFYTYAYSFGQLLVLALYQQYRLEGESFIPRYFQILSYGGSEAPVRILEEAGVDVASPAFWQGGYDVLKDMISELEAL